MGFFHRAIVVRPHAGAVEVWVEDDMHHMRVVLAHDGERITGIDAKVLRAPWTTCPGAEAALAHTFTGAVLAEAARTSGKKHNCTHLFDIAVLGAAHAASGVHTRYDLRVTDPAAGVRELTAHRDGGLQMHWVEHARRFTAPAPLAGKSLLEIGEWIAALDPEAEECARLLRGAGIISHGRTIPIENQSDASKIPPQCFTFQPEMAAQARRIVDLKDFTHDFTGAMDGAAQGPLAGISWP